MSTRPLLLLSIFCAALSASCKPDASETRPTDAGHGADAADAGEACGIFFGSPTEATAAR